MFSIIIPCHNKLELLKKVLAGFANQNKQYSFNYEIILVDNNSQDNIYEVYKEYVSKLPIYLLTQPTLPNTYALCHARNLGLKIANHPWIICLDADCIPNQNYLDNLYSYITQHNTDNLLIAGERIFIDTNHLSDKNILNNKDILSKLPRIKSQSNYMLSRDRRLDELQSLATHPHPWALMHGGNLVFSKDAAYRAKMFDEEYDGYWGYEDIDFAFRIITKDNAKPTYLDNIYCYHQEPYYSEEHKNNLAIAAQRNNKKDNPNFDRIAKLIPGYKEFKLKKYKKFDIDAE